MIDNRISLRATTLQPHPWYSLDSTEQSGTNNLVRTIWYALPVWLRRSTLARLQALLLRLVFLLQLLGLLLMLLFQLLRAGVVGARLPHALVVLLLLLLQLLPLLVLFRR